MKKGPKNKKEEIAMFTIDRRLDKYSHVVLFPKQLERARERLRKIGMLKDSSIS